jgi:hypothetical protein
MITYLHNNGNDVQFNQTHVWLQSGEHRHPLSGTHGMYVFPQSFRMILAYYNSRCLIKSDWVKTNNVYLPPLVKTTL